VESHRWNAKRGKGGEGRAEVILRHIGLSNPSDLSVNLGKVGTSKGFSQHEVENKKEKRNLGGQMGGKGR